MGGTVAVRSVNKKNDFRLVLMVDAQEMEFFEDPSVFRLSVNQHLDASGTVSGKNIDFFFSHNVSCPVDFIHMPCLTMLGFLSKTLRHEGPFASHS